MKKYLLTNCIDLKINQLCSLLSLQYIYIKEEQYFTPLKNLITHQSTNPLIKIAIPEKIMILCNLEDEEIDEVLKQCKEKKIEVDYKAILTPYNQEWSLLKLYQQLKQEKEGMN